MSATNSVRSFSVKTVTQEQLTNGPINLSEGTDPGPSYGGGGLTDCVPVLEQYENYASLMCPKCGAGHDVHQRAYEVFAREKEDERATRIAINNANCQGTNRVSVLQEPSASAPSRRDTIAIQFHCLNCDALPVLHIRQHKGATLIWCTIPAVLHVDRDEE